MKTESDGAACHSFITLLDRRDPRTRLSQRQDLQVGYSTTGADRQWFPILTKAGNKDDGER